MILWASFFPIGDCYAAALFVNDHFLAFAPAKFLHYPHGYADTVRVPCLLNVPDFFITNFSTSHTNNYSKNSYAPGCS